MYQIILIFKYSKDGYYYISMQPCIISFHYFCLVHHKIKLKFFFYLLAFLWLWFCNLKVLLLYYFIVFMSNWNHLIVLHPKVNLITKMKILSCLWFSITSTGFSSITEGIWIKIYGSKVTTSILEKIWCVLVVVLVEPTIT